MLANPAFYGHSVHLVLSDRHCISLKLRFITSCVLRSACVQHWNLIWKQSEVCAAGSRPKHTHRFGLTFYTKMLSSRSVSAQRCCLLPYLVDKVAYVSWVGGCGAERVLVVMVEGPLIQTSDPHFDALWLQGIRLLQLAKVIVLHTHTNTQMLALQWVTQPCITILPQRALQPVQHSEFSGQSIDD